MPELGRYAAAVLSAYGVSLALLAAIVVQSFWRARRIARDLHAAERRAGGPHGG